MDADQAVAHTCQVKKPVLTIREEEILKLICEGWERREIARMMDLSHHTIGNHWKSIQAKTECHKVARLVIWAVVHGVIDPRKV